jgi:2-dehydro-3-deoxygalactonokinase
MAGRAPDAPGEAFARGVARGLGDAGLLHDLFGARTLALAGELAADEVPDWLSGVLIGHEIRSARAWARRCGDDAAQVRVVGEHALTERYAVALAHAGNEARPAAAGAAARGLAAIARRAHLIE